MLYSQQIIKPSDENDSNASRNEQRTVHVRQLQMQGTRTKLHRCSQGVCGRTQTRGILCCAVQNAYFCKLTPLECVDPDSLRFRPAGNVQGATYRLCETGYKQKECYQSVASCRQQGRNPSNKNAGRVQHQPQRFRGTDQNCNHRSHFRLSMQ